MALGVEPVPEIEVESLCDWSSLCIPFVFATDLSIFVFSMTDYIAAKACKDNALLGDINASFLHHVWVALKAPEDLGIQFMVEGHEFFVILNIVCHYEIGGFSLSNDNGHDIYRGSCPHPLDLGDGVILVDP